MQDLKPGVFLDPRFIRAAELLQQMATRYFQPGAMAMTHTTHAMNGSSAGFNARSTTNTFHRAGVALAKASGAVAMDAAFTMNVLTM